MTNITGRDHHIICKALAIAIQTIDCADERHQPYSDRMDMEKLLDAFGAFEREVHEHSVWWIFSGGLDLSKVRPSPWGERLAQLERNCETAGAEVPVRWRHSGHSTRGAPSGHSTRA